MPALNDAQTAAYTAFLKGKRESYSFREPTQGAERAFGRAEHTRTCRVHVLYNSEVVIGDARSAMCVLCGVCTCSVRAAAPPTLADRSVGGVRIRSSRPRTRGGSDGAGAPRFGDPFVLGGWSDPYAIYYFQWSFPLLQK